MKTLDAIAKFHRWMSDRRLMRRTRECYDGHVRRYCGFSKNSAASPEDSVSAYLSWLAANRSQVTQNQALNAMVAFYRSMDRPLGTLPEWVKPREHRRVPTWVTQDEAATLIGLLPQPWNEVAGIMFGSGLRIGEVLNLRSKDLDSATGTITVRAGKGDKDRVTMLPKSMVPTLSDRYQVNRAVWESDRAANRNPIYVPDSVARKIPRAGEQWPWFWVFPAPGESRDPETGIIRRHHRVAEGFSKALSKACTLAKLHKRVTAHAFRHGFATSYLINGGNIHELSELMGHADIRTTEIYLHCIPQLASRVHSPLDNVIAFRKTA
jgi:integron integrase